MGLPGVRALIRGFAFAGVMTVTATLAGCSTMPNASSAQRLKHLPVWIFHGAKDDVAPPRESREISIALKEVGADVRYTEFPEANHNSWDPAYSRTPELWLWLFAQRRQ